MIRIVSCYNCSRILGFPNIYLESRHHSGDTDKLEVTLMFGDDEVLQHAWANFNRISGY